MPVFGRSRCFVVVDDGVDLNEEEQSDDDSAAGAGELLALPDTIAVECYLAHGRGSDVGDVDPVAAC